MTKVLHIVGRMQCGGVETWVLNVVRNIDQTQIQMDFLVHTNEPGAYDNELRRLGSKILPCLHPHRPARYARGFRRTMEEFGPYDVVHSHVHHFSGCVLRLAHRAGVPVRIAHSHVSTECYRPPLRRRLYVTTMRRWIQQHATLGLAASAECAETLFGPDWSSNPKISVHHCGIDLRPFRQTTQFPQVKKELGIPQGIPVLGHVGRFDSEKNHSFLIEVIASLVRRGTLAHLALVGDGPLRSEVEAQAARHGVSKLVHFAGVRRDVPRLMLNCFAILVLPSRCEGLPLVVLEAQAAGLRSVVSRAVTREAAVLPAAVKYLPLESGPVFWAEEIAHTLGCGRVGSDEAKKTLSESDFNIERGAKALTSLYEDLASAKQ